jgi:uncharacterized oxidoreductase
MQMTGNTILITGGGSGIGKALALEFHKRDNQVIIAGRRKNVLDEVTAANPGMKSIVLDIQNLGGLKDFAAQLVKDFPTLNGIFNVAGVMKPENLTDGSDNSTTASDTVAINLLATIALTEALLPNLLQQPRATVMTVTSGLAFLPLALTPTYCATKAAVHSYTQSLRYQLRDTKVDVLELIPPYVATELQGPQQAADPRAMPLADFIAEVMTILETQPDAKEICVKNVYPLRYAAEQGYEKYTQQFNGFNKAMSSH